MASELTDAIKQLVQDKGISEELVRRTIEELLLAAYKKKYGTEENALVQFDEDGQGVALLAQKIIVEEVMDPALELSLEEAKEYDDDAEIGDELLLEIDPRDFDRGAVQSAKQKARQTLRDIQKDTLYSEFKEKEGEMVIGYHQRERNGNIFVDLGRIEGIMPKRYQSPRETYRPNDRIKAMIYEVGKTAAGLNIVLTRTHTDFVRRVFELEVPEIYDRVVEISKIVREPGYRTKLAVFSHRDDVDSVGACVGLRGIRIQAIVRELEGEKIDILKYDTDPRVFIKNALSPAEVDQVVILNEERRQALAVVQEKQFSLAIGKQGLNVRLANRLTDWNIDVKTVEQFEEMDIAVESKKAVSSLFETREAVEEEEITRVEELPGITDKMIELLAAHKIELIQDLLSLGESELKAIDGFSDGDVGDLQKIIAENVDIIDEEGVGKSESGQQEPEAGQTPEEAEEEGEEEEDYACPDCGSRITIDMDRCPSCGVGISFEFTEEDSEQEPGEE